MTNYREILRLFALGINKVNIADSCECSRNTVADVLRRAAELGLSYPLPDGMSDKELTERLFPGQTVKPGYKMPDYERIHREMQKSGVTLSLLWVEYCEECRESGEIPYKSTQFNKYYNDYINSTSATMHIDHKPGEIIQVDWAGDTAHVIDSETGELIDAYVFVSSLPYSGYAYVEAFFSMNQESWIAAHVNAFNYFGGVCRIIQSDNLKTGVEKHTKSELKLNRSYYEMAEYYGTAIIPCRVRAPRDKGHVEGTVGIISTWIIAAIRNRQFMSLGELNAAIREKLEEFNHKEFQKKSGSRADIFEEEKLFLLPLPEHAYELATWKTATVSSNYHINTDYQNYSVPYEYIKQQVDVRTTKNVVEVFFEGSRIASHPRLYGRFGQYSTLENHMPPDHQKYLQWNGDRFRKWASKIGDNCVAVTELFLESGRVEQQGYKSCMALLKLADRYSAERIEYACGKALSYTQRPSLKSIQTILQSCRDDGQTEETSPDTDKYAIVRGADYYRKDRGND